MMVRILSQPHQITPAAEFAELAVRSLRLVRFSGAAVIAPGCPCLPVGCRA